MPDLPTWSRTCNPGQPSPTWKALHCYEGDQRCTGHGRTFVAWHSTEAAERKTRKHPMFKTENIWKTLKNYEHTVCENNGIIEDSLIPWSFLGVHAPFPSVTLDIKHVGCQSLPELFHVVPCLLAYTGAQIKPQLMYEVSGNHRRWTTPSTTYRVSRDLDRLGVMLPSESWENCVWLRSK